MSQCQVLYNNKPLERVRHGKKMTLRDHDIKSSATLVVTKPGITLTITDPKVSMIIIQLLIILLFDVRISIVCIFVVPITKFSTS